MLGIIITEHLDNMLGKSVLDLSMPWHRLSNFGFQILIPVMFAAVTDENTTHVLKPFYQLAPFHDISRSATLRTLGIVPLVNSL